MLSVCIPVFNRFVGELTSDILSQCRREEFPFEIILADDGSKETFRQENRRLGDLKEIRYIELEQNVGRAEIRNFLAGEAKFPWLLFLDCDSKIISDNFIHSYRLQLGEIPVICGGRIYPDSPPEDLNQKLHYIYGVERESKPAAFRKRNPYASFMTNNFVIQKSIFQFIRFDNRIKNYGHEDTLFGFYIRENKILISHIDNPVLHDELENSTSFLKKSKQAIENLYDIWILTGKDLKFSKLVKILNTFSTIRRFHLQGIIKLLIKPLIFKIETQLCSPRPRLILMDIWKLYQMIDIEEYKKIR